MLYEDRCCSLQQRSASDFEFIAEYLYANIFE